MTEGRHHHRSWCSSSPRATWQNEDLSTAWTGKKDGASRIAQLLFEEATDIRFIVGRAINPAHQNPDLPISIVIKMGLIDELAEILRKMGKQVTVSYY